MTRRSLQALTIVALLVFVASLAVFASDSGQSTPAAIIGLVSLVACGMLGGRASSAPR